MAVLQGLFLMILDISEGRKRALAERLEERMDRGAGNEKLGPRPLC